MEINKILGREQHTDLIEDSFIFNDCNILITGAKGSIGKRLAERLEDIHTKVYETDIDTLDVTNWYSIKQWQDSHANMDYVINCAGAKHAPLGEDETIETMTINTIGTWNLINAFKNSKIILTSTCKSCNPETVYGASKLIAERLILNNGGSVARFYNVVETSGNIFELWQQQNPKLVVEDCNRYFISLDEAVGLIQYTMANEQGRYSVNPEKIRNMKEIFNAVYPNQNYQPMKARRGDRMTELLHSTSEFIESSKKSILKIRSKHD